MPKAENAVSFKVGQKIQYFRRVQGVSVEYLAEMVSLSPQQIRKYEAGDSKIKIDILFDISLALGVPLLTLACESEF